MMTEMDLANGEEIEHSTITKPNQNKHYPVCIIK